MISLSEVEYIRKPQKYMIFSGKLFKIIFDLIGQTQFFAHEALMNARINRQKSKLQTRMQKVDKELN